MIKFYVSVVVCLVLHAQVFAQNFYWVGPINGNWSNSANWSASAGGPGGAGVPNGTSQNAVFSATASLRFDLSGTTNLGSLSITSNATVRITSAAGDYRVLQLNSSNAAAPALRIDAGSRLEHIVENGPGDDLFECTFAPNAKGEINGIWYLNGAGLDDAAFFSLPTSGAATLVNVNSGAAVIAAQYGFVAVDVPARNFLRFNSGSTLQLDNETPSVPNAIYHANSTILVTGITQGADLSFEETDQVGNIVYDCPNQLGPEPSNLGLLDGLQVLGNVDIRNTNGNQLTLLSNFNPPSGVVTASIAKDLKVTGNSRIAVSDVQVPGNNNPYNLTVGGNLIANGTAFSIQNSVQTSLSATRLAVAGDISHLSGTFTVEAIATSNAENLFTLELNGSAAQNIFSHNGVFDNNTNQLNLQVNNAAGVTLASNLAVGRLTFTNGVTGNLTTGSFTIAVRGAATDPIVLSRPANAGFVNGTLSRVLAGTQTVAFPVGEGSVFRQVEVTPATAVPSVYEARYFNAVSTTNVASPLKGVPNYQWRVNKVSGADAFVRLTLTAPVPGATASDVLVAARLNGSIWENDWNPNQGSLPGSSSSGSVNTRVLSGNAFFTIAYASNAALPIVLLSFDGRKEDGQSARLDWRLTANSTPAYFDVLKSVDGKDFTKLGSLPGLEGKSAYTFRDASLSTGNTYYRLKMVDKDGSVTYSEIIVLTNGSKEITISNLMPTLVRDRAKLTVNATVSGRLQLVIVDGNGRTVGSQATVINKGSQEIWIDANRLPAGMFYITGYLNGEKTAAIRFIKQ